MFWRRYILITLLITTRFVGVFACPPGHDILIYRGDTIFVYGLNRLPVGNLFGGRNICGAGDGDEVISTGGNTYTIVWEIENNQLYLIGIYSMCYDEDSVKADLNELFGEKAINGRVKADWITSGRNWISLTNVTRGGKELIAYYYGTVPMFKKEFEFEFLEGKLLNVDTFDHPKARRLGTRQSIHNRNNSVYTNIDWDNLPKLQEPIIVTLTVSVNEDGEIDEVEVVRKSDIELFNQEAIRVVKSIPDWDVIFIRGQHIRAPWDISILFSEENRRKFGR
jgi:hypothetical protein